MKKYTEKKAAALGNKLLNAARRSSYKNAARAIENAFDIDGKCYITDGIRAYCLNKRPAGLSEILRAETPTREEAEKQSAFHSHIVKLFSQLDNGTLTEMPAPDADALKLSINSDESNNRFDLGENMPCVNPRYMLDIVNLLPGAKWYYTAGNIMDPVFAASPDGAAILLPIRVFRETPAPASKPETAYTIFAKTAKDRKYARADMQRGLIGVGALHAPIYPESRLEKIKQALDGTAAINPGASFQIRTTDGKKIVYTTPMTYTPEAFIEKYAA